MSKALIRVQPKYRPVSGELQGMRIQAALPNMAARKMVRTTKGFAAIEQRVPAFRKPYLILETGDQWGFSESDLDRFKKKLQWEGFSEFEMLTTLSGEKLEAPLPEAVQKRIAELQAQIDRAGVQPQVEDAPF